MAGEQTQNQEKNFVQELMEWTEETVQQNLAMFKCRQMIKELEKEIDQLKDKVRVNDQSRYNWFLTSVFPSLNRFFYSVGKYKTFLTAKNSFPTQQRRYDDRREEFSWYFPKRPNSNNFNDFLPLPP